MNNVIIIEKNSSVKNMNVDLIDNLYKYCNYRNNNDFNQIYKWNHDIYIYELYGKTKGKKINKNMIKLPEYISNELYGNICFVKKDLHNNVTQFNIEEWESWYSTIFNEGIQKNKDLLVNNSSYDKLYYEYYESD